MSVRIINAAAMKRLKKRAPDTVWMVAEHIQLCVDRCRQSEAPEGWVWSGSHRRPPLAHYHRKAEKGRCRVCWKTEGMTPRSTWHRECVTAYNFFTSPHTTLLAYLQDHLCARCGIPIGLAVRTKYGEGRWSEWTMRLKGTGRLHDIPEADHIKPLYRVRRENRDMRWGDLLWFWTPANMQALCRDCHVEKCAEEAKERAAYAAQGAENPSLLDLMEATE